MAASRRGMQDTLLVHRGSRSGGRQHRGSGIRMYPTAVTRDAREAKADATNIVCETRPVAVADVARRWHMPDDCDVTSVDDGIHQLVWYVVVTIVSA